jgi:hypothetical protein
MRLPAFRYSGRDPYTWPPANNIGEALHHACRSSQRRAWERGRRSGPTPAPFRSLARLKCN